MNYLTTRMPIKVLPAVGVLPPSPFKGRAPCEAVVQLLLHVLQFCAGINSRFVGEQQHQSAALIIIMEKQALAEEF